MRALLAVAHPDDETVYAGSLLLANPDWSWRIFCATSDGDRVIRLMTAIEDFRARGVRIDGVAHGMLFDGPPVPADGWADDLWQRLLDTIPPTYDIVFTHNRRGDYGHPHHCAVNYAVHGMFREEIIWEFWTPYESGVGHQWQGVNTRHFSQRPGKALVLNRAYPDEVRALQRDRPALLTQTFESFTSNGEWPE